MSKVPSGSYDRIVAAVVRVGFAVILQRGSHIRVERTIGGRTLRITVPAHRPVKGTTLSRVLKQAEVTRDDFLDALQNDCTAGDGASTLTS